LAGNLEKQFSNNLIQKTKLLWLRKYNLAISDEQACVILGKLALFGELLLKATESTPIADASLPQRAIQ
jgi:hypothetical protein